MALTTIVLSAGRPTVVKMQGAELVVTAGPDAGRKATLQGRSLSIGTEATNGLALTDRAVSRLHCRIEASDTELVLKDLGSSNGTLVDGVRIRECVLQDGQTVRVGTSAIQFRWTNTAVDLPLSEEDSFGDAIGRSVPMRELFVLLARISATDVPVLLRGETGTGKEIIAEAIHRRSRRSRGPFEIVDCSALAPSLIESELFGYERGAFTGAAESRPGAFERAHGGTAFLDEIGELHVDLQPKLLRVLESGEVRRLGGGPMRRVDARIVAATSRDVDAMLAGGGFRQDLFHRVAVMTARIPPLRERPGDIPELAAHFLHRMRYTEDIAPAVLRNYVELALGFLRGYSWPGNVRELRNVVERAAILADTGKIEADALSRLNAITKAIEAGGAVGRLPMRVATEQFERDYLTELMRLSGGNLRAASATAQLHPKSLERLLRKHRLRLRGQ